MKATAQAPSNIALIKYWGKKDEKLRLPANGSISVNLSGLQTTTTVEFSDKYENDEVVINREKIEKETARVNKQLDRIRKLAGFNLKAKVVSQNNFPTAQGLASSASGFAALTQAATKAANLKLSEKKLTILTRLGSGSACRSIPDGFVEWKYGEKSQSSYATSIFPNDYWDISIIAVVINAGRKEVSTTDGHKLASTSPFFKTRLKLINKKIDLIKHLIKQKNFTGFGELVEAETLEMHAIMLSSNPPLLYWSPTTVEVMKLTGNLRKRGLPVYFTIDAGPHLFLICQNENVSTVVDNIKKIKNIDKIIINRPADGARLTNDHLF